MNETMMGPLAYNACRDNAERYIEQAKRTAPDCCWAASARYSGYQGRRVCRAHGFEVYDNRMELMQEEIFAPVVGIMKVKDGREAAELTNDSRYGLCASVWTMDYRKGMLLTEKLNVGTAWVNQHLAIVSETPWGGRKESGWTKENSILVLDEYTYHKHVDKHSETPNTFWADKLK